MTILLHIFNFHLKIIYFFIKLLTYKKNQVFFLSRQTNKPSLNYTLLINYIKQHNVNISIKVSCKKVSNNLNKVLHNKSNYNVLYTIFKELKECLKYYFLLYKQMYYLATSKIIITDGYNILISVLNHKKNTTIIQMWHALAAIKQFGCQNIGKLDGMSPKIAHILKIHKNYDYVLSGSVAMKKSFSEAFNIEENKVLSIGTPYIDYLLNHKITKENLFKNLKLDKNKKVILYSPTFRKNGRNKTSEVVKAFKDNYNLIVTLHPLEKVNSKDLSGILLNPEIDYADLLLLADYVITDYSALMIESAIVKTKFLLYVYDYEEYAQANGLNIDLFQELPLITFQNIDDIVNIIESGNYDMLSFNKFRKKFITNLSKDSTQKIYNLIEGELYAKKN